MDPLNPSTIFVAGWKLDKPGGGLWVSHDGGRSWSVVAALRGQSIRAFAQAPSNPAMLFAGTLEGVFRSTDDGVSWTRISPPRSREIHEVESLAIDPADPDVVYAGTWHLPWKTTDGGKNWSNIKKGVIDDSDVFSIIIDPTEPKIVFASACSGIYKSASAGEVFKKIEGIPDTARRTRVLRQDPANRDVVYAGTTEGLYKTLDSGKTFERMTGPDVIVNDVFVDPEDTNHVLLATDRGGVLQSRDAGASFAARESRLFRAQGRGAAGGQRKSRAAVCGRGQRQGLRRRFCLHQWRRALGADWPADSMGAMFLRWPSRRMERFWRGRITAFSRSTKTPREPARIRRVGAHAAPSRTRMVTTATETHGGKRVTVEKRVKDASREMDGRVHALDLSGDAWLASTSGGLFSSVDHGASWQGGPVMGSVDYLSVAAHGDKLVAARGDGVVLSTDAGATWMPISIPAMLTRIHCAAFSADGTLWLGAREGVYFSRNLGKTWLWVHRLPLNDVDDLTYDQHLGKILVSSQSSDQVFAIDPKSLDWKFAETGYRINLVRAEGGHMLAASMFDGVVVEPKGTGTRE